MKIKTIDQHPDEKNEDFDDRVNDFLKDKQVIQITTNDTIDTENNYSHTLTVLYEKVIKWNQTTNILRLRKRKFQKSNTTNAADF